uniref:Uncharacterized protein n=1 Tax=Anguilla anguilla TaxID=7936 RepID=A0A0E9VAF8_ANGAN
MISFCCSCKVSQTPERRGLLGFWDFLAVLSASLKGLPRETACSYKKTRSNTNLSINSNYAVLKSPIQGRPVA